MSLWNGILVEYDGGAFTTNYISKLISNIKSGLKEANVEAKIVQSDSKLFIETTQIKEALSITQRVFGVTRTMPYIRTELRRVHDTLPSVSERFLKQGFFPMVKVRSIDSKSISMQEMAQAFDLGKTPNLKDESMKTIDVSVEVVGDVCHLYADHLAVVGPGGLPIGAGDRVICLVSGGIDSPVATWMMMRRGCPVAILFAYFPMGGDESDLKRFISVVRELRKWHIGEEMQVYVYKHDQNLVVFRKTALRFTCILCRRMMYRVANEFANIVKAKAIVTGENLAQVASQTLQNLSVINQASKLPVLRPLIGLDKEEIVKIAKHIGTYEASCIRVSSGCTPIKGCWARPPKPVTYASLDTIIKIESSLNIRELLERSVDSLRKFPDEWFTS
ncbi:tRNA sulfurtransferase [Candidatus Bathyarchaeota archaeon]|nr:tRNA sulfurtransferase [Candidatus Bathyarchaeota archaeon]